jgi:hypothetical protein
MNTDAFGAALNDLEDALREYEAIKDAFVPVATLKARLADWGTVRQRRERKPRVPAQFDRAIKAGLPARLERRPDGTVIVEIGQAGAADKSANEADNELARWRQQKKNAR